MTTPLEFTVAFDSVAVLHVPPVGVLLRVVVPPEHTVKLPDIADKTGNEIMVMVAVVL